MDNSTALIIVAFINLVGVMLTGMFGWIAATRAREAATSSAKNAETLADIQHNVLVVEKATNSMKDELVKATAVAAKSEGRDEERTANLEAVKQNEN